MDEWIHLVVTAVPIVGGLVVWIVRLGARVRQLRQDMDAIKKSQTVCQSRVEKKIDDLVSEHRKEAKELNDKMGKISERLSSVGTTLENYIEWRKNGGKD